MRKFTKYPSGYVKADTAYRELSDAEFDKLVDSYKGERSWSLIVAELKGTYGLDMAKKVADAVIDANSSSIEASTETNPYMKDLIEYLDYLSDDEIDAIQIEHIDDGYEPEGWLEIPEYLRSTVENAIGSDLCSPNESYWYQIEYHPDDDSIFFGINTDLNLETLRGVSKQTEERFKAKFKRELGI